MDTSFGMLGRRVEVLSSPFRLFTVFVPEAVGVEVLAPDSRHPQRVYGDREMSRLLDGRGALSIRNPAQRWPQFHAGEAAALALAQEEAWWLLISEQRALTSARQRGLKAVTVPEFIVYLYQAHLLSYQSALTKLDELAPNTGQRVMQAARQTLLGLAQRRGER
jgi:predicted nucleic acid-binding protein